MNVAAYLNLPVGSSLLLFTSSCQQGDIPQRFASSFTWQHHTVFFFFDDRTSLTWWHGVLSCWNKTSEDEYAVVIMRWKLSAIMLRYVVKPRSADAKGPKLIYKAWWIHGFMLFAANSDPPTRMWQQKSRLIRAGNIFLSFYCPIVVSTFAK